MSGKKPTHDEFAVIWVRSQSAYQASKMLVERGYVEMTPRMCLHWFRQLWSMGIRLPERPYLNLEDVKELVKKCTEVVAKPSASISTICPSELN